MFFYQFKFIGLTFFLPKIQQPLLHNRNRFFLDYLLPHQNGKQKNLSFPRPSLLLLIFIGGAEGDRTSNLMAARKESPSLHPLALPLKAQIEASTVCFFSPEFNPVIISSKYMVLFINNVNSFFIMDSIKKSYYSTVHS
jgi:hypothetical protein